MLSSAHQLLQTNSFAAELIGVLRTLSSKLKCFVKNVMQKKSVPLKNYDFLIILGGTEVN